MNVVFRALRAVLTLILDFLVLLLLVYIIVNAEVGALFMFGLGWIREKLR